jgi:methionyl-tRNA formyltransferase
MRILICCKLDLTSCVAVNELLSSFAKDQHEWRIVLSDKVNDLERSLPSQYDLAFYERDEFINWSQNLTAGNQTYLPFHLLSKRYNVSHETLKDINTDTRFLHRIAVWKPDLIISIRYNYIFKQPIIDLAQRAVVNLHPGKLPDYAGFYAPFWAMKNGDNQIICTLHGIPDETIDSGDIYAEVPMQVNPKRSVMWHFTELYRRGIPPLVELIDDVSSHIRVKGRVQNPDHGSMFRHPPEEDMKAFEEETDFKMVSHEDYLEECESFQSK